MISKVAQQNSQMKPKEEKGAKAVLSNCKIGRLHKTLYFFISIIIKNRKYDLYNTE